MNLKDHIRSVPDFPKPGILFYDISTLLADAEAWQVALGRMAKIVSKYQPDMLAGIESRGFLVAAPLASRLGLGFTMVRKKGKLPGKTVAHEYALEYGTDTIEIQEGAVEPGQRVVIVDDLLIVSCDGSDIDYVAALDRGNGKLRWKTSRPQVPNPRKFSFTTPLVIEVAGKKQLISSGTDIVAAYEPATGKEIWRVTYDGYSVVPRPIFGHGLVYICTGWSPPKLLAIRPNGTGDVTESHVEWKTPRGVPNTPSTILVGDELYFISDRGVITCVNAKTGESHWTKRVGGGFSASPVYADGKIYFQSEQGEAIVIKPGLKYEELARNQFPGERTLASYAIFDSALFIRTGTSLYRIQK